MKIKKTSQQINEQIISELDSGPKTITELKDLLGSNWQTIEKFLKELEKEEKVKEIISLDKRKVYQLSNPDTYFEIPITSKEREKFNTLYYLILEQYKLKKRIPTKTEFAKVAVDVITESEELKNLPTIWYLYGMIPLKAAEPSQEYFKEFDFQHERKINNLIINSIEEKKNQSSTEMQIAQHKRHGELIYVYCDEFVEETKNSWNMDKIFETLNKLYISCPIDEEFQIFEFFDKFNSTFRKVSLLLNNKIDEHKRGIILTFDSLWNYFATYRAYKSIQKLNKFKDKKDILNFYVGNMLESRKEILKESLSNFYSIYLNNLREDIELKTSPEINEIRNIMEDLY